jgi:hypothetical protein
LLGQRQRLVLGNPAIRQCRSKLPHASGRYFGGVDVQRSEIGESFEVFQPCVGDFGGGELQTLEIGEPFEVFQPGIGDLGEAEDQYFEAGQSFQVL